MRKRRQLTIVVVGVLTFCILGWALAYYFVGVDWAFIAGMVRARTADGRPSMFVAPAGVEVTIYADGLDAPTSLAWSPDGVLYVADGSRAGGAGRITALTQPDRRVTVAEDIPAPLGIVFHDGWLYIGRRGGVTRLRDTNSDRVADTIEPIIDGLPALRHQTDGIAFGPDGRMVIGQGSRSDRGELVGIEPLEASILVADADGSNLRVYASGLRNPYDLAFHPQTRELFATDNGRDVPSQGVSDELNVIVDGGDYGWPDCWDQDEGSNCEGAVAPIALFEEHGSANGLAFYAGSMFPQWRDNLFVALFGANSGDPSIGKQVVRVELMRALSGEWVGKVYPWASGFANPLDVTVGPDGAIYVADFGAGKVYRFAAP